ncbi:MAG: ATP-binding cassette domain-containing protein, partial [Rhodocyclaceae bacterium]|nr:ATP-binding cassette domain-containing protein [Rhodocyclaceae bacterium]
PSSRQYPWIGFDYSDKEKLHRLAVEMDKLNFAYVPGTPVIRNFSAAIEAGEKVAIIGENGVGKTTLLRLLAGAALHGLAPTHGKVKWAEKARPGYFAQDHAADFATDMSLTDWMGRWVREGGYEGGEVETLIRGTLGRLLFSGDEVKKSVKVISGGEQGRMLFGKLILLKNNVLLMDEPTNHLDMESIESLNNALEKYAGTLIFVSHDREFVSSLATRIIEIKTDGTITDYRGNYEEYLASQGVD